MDYIEQGLQFILKESERLNIYWCMALYLGGVPILESIGGYLKAKERAELVNSVIINFYNGAMAGAIITAANGRVRQRIVENLTDTYLRGNL